MKIISKLGLVSEAPTGVVGAAFIGGIRTYQVNMYCAWLLRNITSGGRPIGIPFASIYRSWEKSGSTILCQPLSFSQAASLSGTKPVASIALRDGVWGMRARRAGEDVIPIVC